MMRRAEMASCNAVEFFVVQCLLEDKGKTFGLNKDETVCGCKLDSLCWSVTRKWAFPILEALTAIFTCTRQDSIIAWKTATRCGLKQNQFERRKCGKNSCSLPDFPREYRNKKIMYRNFHGNFRICFDFPHRCMPPETATGGKDEKAASWEDASKTVIEPSPTLLFCAVRPTNIKLWFQIFNDDDSSSSLGQELKSGLRPNHI